MQNKLEIAIIGAGPAGVTAAIYAKRANWKPILFTKEQVGGKIWKTMLIENFPGIATIDGPRLAQKFIHQVDYLNIPVKHEEIQFLTYSVQTQAIQIRTAQKQYSFSHVIIATGCRERKLNIPSVVQYEGLGVSYCSSCDGYFFKDQVVAVIGAGTTAFEETLVLATIAKKVYILNQNAKVTAQPILIDRIAKLKNVEIINHVTLQTALGKKSLEKLVLFNSQTQKTQTLIVSGLFIFIGSLPNHHFLDSQLNLTNKDGFIETNSQFATKIPGLYAVGDIVANSLQQYTTAMSSATTAIHSIIGSQK